MKEIKQNNNDVITTIEASVEAWMNKWVEDPVNKSVLKARAIIPVITSISADPSDEFIVVPRIKYTGQAIISNQRLRTLPLVEFETEKETSPLKFIGMGVEIGPDDRDKINAGKSNPGTKVNATLRIVAQNENDMLLGQLSGISGVNVYTCPNGGGGTALWADKTPEEILADINGMIAMHTSSAVFIARTLVVDSSLMDKFISQVQTISTDELIDIMRRKNIIVEFVPNFGDVMLTDNTESNFGFVEALALGRGTTYQEGRCDVIPIEEKITGVVLLQPQSITRAGGAI